MKTYTKQELIEHLKLNDNAQLRLEQEIKENNHSEMYLYYYVNGALVSIDVDSLQEAEILGDLFIENLCGCPVFINKGDKYWDWEESSAKYAERSTGQHPEDCS